MLNVDNAFIIFVSYHFFMRAYYFSHHAEFFKIHTSNTRKKKLSDYTILNINKKKKKKNKSEMMSRARSFIRSNHPSSL